MRSPEGEMALVSRLAEEADRQAKQTRLVVAGLALVAATSLLTLIYVLFLYSPLLSIAVITIAGIVAGARIADFTTRPKRRSNAEELTFNNATSTAPIPERAASPTTSGRKGAVPQIRCPACGTSMPYTRAACPQCKRSMINLP